MATFELIQSTTLTSAAASVVFSSIPQTYTDLVIQFMARNTTGTGRGDAYLTFNSSSTSYYDIAGSNSATTFPVSTRSNIARIEYQPTSSTSAAGYASNTEIYIPDYTKSKYKTSSTYGILEANSATTLFYIIGDQGLLVDSSAITSITLTSAGTTFTADSTFSLYGI